MPIQINEITPGFGERLREERSRLKKNQAEFAELARIRRLAQSQYEAETTSPTVRYLCSIAEAGVDLNYILFGKRSQVDKLTLEMKRRVERKAFDLVEEYAKKQPNDALSAEARFVLFEVLRANLTQTAVDECLPELHPAVLSDTQHKKVN